MKFKKSILISSVVSIITLPILMVSCSFSNIGIKASNKDLIYSATSTTYDNTQTQNERKFTVTIIEKWDGVKTHSTVPGHNGHFQNIIWDSSNSATNGFWREYTKASSNFSNFTTSGKTKGFKHSAVGQIKYLYKYSFTIDVKQSSAFFTLATRFAPSPDWFGGLSSLNLYYNGWLKSSNTNMQIYSSAVKDQRFTKNGTIIYNKNMNTGPDDSANPFGYIKITPDVT